MTVYAKPDITLELCESHTKLKVFYQGQCIDVSEGGVWDNICEEPWLIEAYIDLIMEEYLLQEKSREILEMEAKRLGWC